MGDYANEIKLATTYIVGIASNPLHDEHLLISSFLKVQYENERTMSAFTNSIKERFKELMRARDGKYHKGSFKEVLTELLYTSFSLKSSFSSDFYDRFIFGKFSFKTIFELLTNEGYHIEEVLPSLAIYDDEEMLVRIEGPFYDIMKEHVDEYNYEECLALCRQHNQDNKK